MIFTSRSYAIGRAHFQVAGGFKTLLAVAAAYIGLVITILGLFAYNEVPARGYRTLATLVMVIQSFTLVVIGSVRVGGCMRTDMMTHMIDSHRLMPIESWRAVLGYLFGTTVHVQLVTLLNFFLLAGLLAYTRLVFTDFVINQLVLVIFGVFVWSFAAMGSLMVRQVMPILILGFIFGGILSISLREFAILPGLSVLASPFLGETIFNLSAGRVSFREVYPLALSGQLAFAALFFVGACRRYRGTYPSTFNVPLALGLVLLWNLVSTVAIWQWVAMGGLLRFGPAGEQPGVPMQIVAAMAVAALLAMVPVHALAAAEMRHPRLPWQRALILAAITLVSILVAAAGLPTDTAVARLPIKTLVSLLAMGAHVAAVYLALRATRHMSQMARGTLLGITLFVLWIVPLLLEVTRWMLMEENTENGGNSYGLSVLGSLSPIGLLVGQWRAAAGDEVLSPLPGLFYQWLVPLALWRLGRRLNRAAGPSDTTAGNPPAGAGATNTPPATGNAPADAPATTGAPGSAWS